MQPGALAARTLLLTHSPLLVAGRTSCSPGRASPSLAAEPAGMLESPTLCYPATPLSAPLQATYLRVANYSLFALFGLAAINEAVIFVVGLRGACCAVLCCAELCCAVLCGAVLWCKARTDHLGGWCVCSRQGGTWAGLSAALLCCHNPTDHTQLLCSSSCRPTPNPADYPPNSCTLQAAPSRRASAASCRPCSTWRSCCGCCCWPSQVSGHSRPACILLHPQ